ncbi:MAG: hypothetical protein PHC95_06965 [Parabacteroides sp.]|nr:hypothetical protein [Parabacteroides sp.]
MGKNYFKRGALLFLTQFLLCGFFGLSAAEVADTLFVQAIDTTLAGEINKPVVFAKPTAKVTLKGVTAQAKLIVKESCVVEFTIEGKNVLSGGFLNEGTTTWLYPKDEGTIEASSINNEGEFDDQTGTVRSVGGSAGFSLTKVWAMASHKVYNTSLYGIGYEGSSVGFMDPNVEEVQIWDNDNKQWIDKETTKTNALKNATKSLRSSTEPLSFQGSVAGYSKPGKYRIKLKGENEENTSHTILYTRVMDLKEITGDVSWSGETTFDALSIRPEGKAVVTFDGVYAQKVKGGRSAVAIPLGSDVTMNLKGDNSSLDSLVVGGKLLLTHEGETQFEETKICNFGVFTDSTGTMQKVYGSAGLWIESLEYQGTSEQVGLNIKTVKTVFHLSDILSSKKATLEVLKEGKWMDSEDLKTEPETKAAALRSEGDDEWPSTSTTYFQTSENGTYRIKYWVKSGDVETTVYSKSFAMTAEAGSITEETKAIGSAEVTTVLPTLNISGGTTEALAASLENVTIEDNAADVPSVLVKEKAHVDLTLKGTNDLGRVKVANAAKITLKPESDDPAKVADLKISSVLNGGMFIDETGTVSLVKDLENRTMIELTDTIVTQIENVMSVSIRSVSNSLEGSYILDAETPQRWNKEASKWEDYLLPKVATKATESVNRTGELLTTISTTTPGYYRIPVVSSDFMDETKGTTLYFVFEIKKVEATVVTDGSKIEGNKDLLIFADNGKEINATLTNVTVAIHENIASTVVEKDQKANITLNGNNDLGEFQVLDGANVTLKKGGQFQSLAASIKNAGKFTDETGMIKTVKDSRGLTMVDISKSQMIGDNGYTIVAYYDFFSGRYEVSDGGITFEKWDGSAWNALDENRFKSVELRADASQQPDGDIAKTLIGLDPGTYRAKVYAEEWIDGIEEGSKKNPHTVVLYQYFSVAAPISYYTVVLPAVAGVTTSPAAGTYSEEEGSYFRFSLTLDPAYDQSKPEVKANGKVLTPDANGMYSINSIYEDVAITITGVTENIPTGNAEVAGNEVKVWATDGSLHIYSPEKANLRIYAFHGGLSYTSDAILGEHTVTLAKGLYIVLIGDRSYKVSL